MSKSPNLVLPAIGGIALMLGAAYGFSSRNYGADTIALLEDRVEKAEARVSSASDKAKAEAERATALELAVAEAQEQAAKGTNLTSPAPQMEGAYGLGRVALAEEIAAWDVDVLPDGRGLPVGSGNAFDGEEVFADKCASCHGDFAEGVDNWPVLAGGFDTLADEDPVKTVGSYWPHLSTVYDYVYRSMPFGEAGTLTPDETYAIVAYILYSNDLIDDEFELSNENLADFDMHNKDGFVIDDRPDLEYATWRTEPCMENCKDAVEITMRSVFLVETPPEGGTNSMMNPAKVEGLPSFSADGPSFIPEAAPKPVKAAVEPAPEPAKADDGDALIEAGKKVFKKCKACHQVGDGAKNKTGPHLNDLFGRTFGSVDGFKYSNTFKAALEEGRVWDEASLAEFLSKPKAYMKGTKMSFSGLKKDSDQQAINAYLATFGN
ncbi:c-type cytochrome [Tropicibacter sp. R16_0]|uniref:c-type cytochrome n=1 Tax=Tropicibacter sp. R16_0 TaxID=2821102 RepID=UPI001AD9981E|nr:c-type cytochrome [Tropicibacter sp. R16_0]MBO9448639.1 c-type cytochrome [Tropicibacter sp. R16_0]